jgi:hypothetical protein
VLEHGAARRRAPADPGGTAAGGAAYAQVWEDLCDITPRRLCRAQARLRGDWDADIAAYDDAHEQALEMADALSAGIIHQFPRKFDRMAAR